MLQKGAACGVTIEQGTLDRSGQRSCRPASPPKVLQPASVVRRATGGKLRPAVEMFQKRASRIGREPVEGVHSRRPGWPRTAVPRATARATFARIRPARWRPQRGCPGWRLPGVDSARHADTDARALDRRRTPSASLPMCIRPSIRRCRDLRNPNSEPMPSAMRVAGGQGTKLLPGEGGQFDAIPRLRHNHGKSRLLAALKSCSAFEN